MKLNISELPERRLWSELCKRPAIDAADLEKLVGEIFSQVAANGDRALSQLAARFDGVHLERFELRGDEIARHSGALDAALRHAIDTALENVETFHRAQLPKPLQVETVPGVVCERHFQPFDAVAIYVPGGTAPLISSLIMMAVPARLAGCPEIVVLTPPLRGVVESGADLGALVHPAILYIAEKINPLRIFVLGGAQSIAAVTLGTETIPKVNKIFGPGNQYVTMAKELARRRGVAIDMPAGPTELLIIADENALPSYVAADLLAQAEHGRDSQVVVVTPSRTLATKIADEVALQLESLPRRDVALDSIGHSRILICGDLDEALAFSAYYAPEHLILAVKEARKYLPKVRNAGSVFLGNLSSEAAGDYASGTNHVLPTAAAAKSYSALSLLAFLREMTVQELSAEGVQALADTVPLLARAERLEGHARSFEKRLAMK